MTGTQDSGANESVFLDDPDGNGLELYYDRPREQWTDEHGEPVFTMLWRFDPEGLLDQL